MKNKHAAGKPAPLGVSAAAAILALPRETKRLIMATADAIAIPTALWAALALKFDRLDPALDRTLAYFLIAVAPARLFCPALGLYRSVIRSMGPSRMLTGTCRAKLHRLVLAGFDRLVAAYQLP